MGTEDAGQLPEDKVTPEKEEITPETEAQKTDKVDKAKPEGDKLPENHKFYGKSAPDIAKAYEELEGKLGEQGQKISTLENNLTFYQQQEEQKRAEQEKQKPQEPQWTKEDEDRFYDNPRKFMNEEMAKFYQGMRYVRVPYDLQEARKQAYRQNAETFKGIEKEVDWLVEQSLRTGAVMPERANDPANYFRAATLIRAEREGFTPQSQRTNVNPVDPVDGEMPAGVKPDKPTKAPVHISDDMKKMVEYLGDGEVSLEDAAEMARGERRKREEMAK